ncbi:hypothetical protein N0V83_009468 [Neocucurbitaria cava]|uniref:Uncharacterized protein n=1 Tax=Neocucurbitaria cava TaxID=798079 RepID=A0A9W8XZP6_9PLEO|nr:hypothetical protein N0V83_009468 [Neocucurbitaria cava]
MTVGVESKESLKKQMLLPGKKGVAAWVALHELEVLADPFMSPEDYIKAALNRRIYPGLLPHVHDRTKRGTKAREALYRREEAKHPGVDTVLKRLFRTFANFDKSQLSGKDPVYVVHGSSGLAPIDSKAPETVNPAEPLASVPSPKKKKSKSKKSKSKKKKNESKSSPPVVEGGFSLASPVRTPQATPERKDGLDYQTLQDDVAHESNGSPVAIKAATLGFHTPGPGEEYTLTGESTPTDEFTPQSTPREKFTPQSTPREKYTPQSTPRQKFTPESTPKEKPTPIEESTPVEHTSPAEEAISVGESTTVEELTPKVEAKVAVLDVPQLDSPLSNYAPVADSDSNDQGPSEAIEATSTWKLVRGRKARQKRTPKLETLKTQIKSDDRRDVPKHPSRMSIKPVEQAPKGQEIQIQKQEATNYSLKPSKKLVARAPKGPTPQESTPQAP